MNVSDFSFYLFDFADVISLPQDMNYFWEMAALLQMDKETFKGKYWKNRRPYDLGQSGKDYWETVNGSALSAESLSQLILLDCKSWGRMNPLTIELLQRLKTKKKTLGLLSNLPIDLVHYVRENFSFTELFDYVFFSAEIHLVKPDKEIYDHVLKVTAQKGEKIIFFDDKEENLKGASALGIHTFLITQESIKELGKRI